MGRSDGAASKSSILPSAVGEADLEAQRASNLAAYMPPLRIKYEGAAAPSCIPKRKNRFVNGLGQGVGPASIKVSALPAIVRP